MSDKFISISLGILSITIAVFLAIMIYALCAGDAPDSKLQRIERLEQRCDSLQQQIDFMVE